MTNAWQPWRDHLKDGEREDIETLDACIFNARQLDREYTARREKIRRRCVARGRMVEVKRLKEGKGTLTPSEIRYVLDLMGRN